MAHPRVELGVPLMDEDHARLEAMFDRVSATPDQALPALLDEIEAETRSHFAREEELMRAADLPILHCHLAQHAMLLGEFRNGHAAVAAGDAVALRRFLGEIMNQMVAAHIESVDAVSASIMREDLGADAVACLRLPLPA